MRAYLVVLVLVLQSLPAQASATQEPDWGKLVPEELKRVESISLERNPFQSRRVAPVERQRSSSLGKSWAVRLRQDVRSRVRGVASDAAGPLLLHGARVLRVGEDYPLPQGESMPSLKVRIKAIEAARLVLLVSEAEQEEVSCEEWTCHLNHLLTKK